MREKSNDPRVLAIGRRIKELRIEKGYTSHEFFAWENKISSSQYYKMENGYNITVKSLLRILDIHGMTLLEFFAGVKEGPGEEGE